MILSTLKRRFACWTAQPIFIFLFLLLLCGLAYALLIPWQHLYIDDWIWVWTWEKLGRAGLVKYFSTNRPFWGLLFQVTLPLLGQNVLAFHLFSLLVRWSSGLACWWLLRLLWPERPGAALTGAVLFLIYPGFALQPIALTYGHIFLVYTFFLLSLCFNLLALRHPRRFVPYTLLALLLSLINLITMEYFFTLELARPFLLWTLSADQAGPGGLKRSRWVAKQWLPYLLLFLGVGLWRFFIFKVITDRYQLILLDQLRGNPPAALWNLGKSVLVSLWNTSFGAWLPALTRLAELNLRQKNTYATYLLAGAAAGIVFLIFLFRSQFEEKPGISPRRAIGVVTLGLTLMLTAGWPFWLTGLDVQPVEFLSRFTMPFMLGTAILLVGLLDLFRPAWLRAGILALLVGTACGYHFQVANTFRLDWENNRQLMWQIAWRIPRMEEGTTLLVTDFPVTYYNTAALATELHMLYPDGQRLPELAYDFLYDREQDFVLGPQGLRRGVPIEDSNVTSVFHGSTSQVLSAQYNLSRCFRLLDPSLDAADTTLPEFTQRAARISDWAWVRTDLPPAAPLASLFGSAPTQEWCYYFEKADLARQMGDWSAAARLGDEAMANALTPRDEMEKLVFIEAYAHTGQWDQALALTRSFANTEKQPMLCRLWERIEANVSASSAKQEAIQSISQPDLCPQVTSK